MDAPRTPRLRAALPIFTIALAAAWLGGCGESREAYRDEMTATICDREAECGNIGPDERFSSYDDCMVETRSDVNDAWPEDECGGKSINEEKFEECISRAETLSCEGGFSGGLDRIAFWSNCNADDVCIDPAD